MDQQKMHGQYLMVCYLTNFKHIYWFSVLRVLHLPFTNISFNVATTRRSLRPMTTIAMAT
jgi:hypothetical protein